MRLEGKVVLIAVAIIRGFGLESLFCYQAALTAAAFLLLLPLSISKKTPTDQIGSLRS